MSRMRTFSTLVAGILLAGTLTVLASRSAPPTETDPAGAHGDLDVLVECMTGSFSSQAQAEADPENFWDIRLEMAPIWTERTDAMWFYVEQAAATHLDKPYRQRVYRVAEPEPGQFTSEVFSLPDPDQAIGAWKLENPLSDIGPDDLSVRVGCTVYLKRRADGSFVGGTRDRDCTSTLRGATFATTEILVTDKKIVSWDRGYNDAGEHVWGAEKAGYEFLKTAM